jgi:hypothetical protein
MGSYLADVPYSDNISDKAVPSGAIILFEGDACPPGYRCIGQDVYLYATFGDPNAFRGDVTGEEELSMCLGENRHDHASTRATETEPAAFEVVDTAVGSKPIRPSDMKNTQILPADENYAGKKIYMLPESHTHLLRFVEDVEPPYVKAKVCEKI